MYAPLYIKTNNSLLESMIKIEELIEYAKENDIKALTITDNRMYGVMEFYKLCKKNDIKPIIGLEVILEGYNIVLYAKDNSGYKNLVHLGTISSEQSLNIDMLDTYSKGLICIVPFKSIKLYDELSKIYSDIYKSYSDASTKKELSGDNLLYMNETLYIYEKDREYINYLYGIKDGIEVSEVKLDKKNNYIIKESVIKKYFSEDIKNNYNITSLCNVDIGFTNDLLPKFDCPNNLDSYSYLKKLCKEGLKKIFGSEVGKVYIDRLKYELDIINRMGFCDYFLVTWDFVKYAKENDIYIGPRGSAAGSLVSYTLNITTVDPIKYNLLFERFLNPERITMPDIDVDIEHSRRDEVLNYCINKYGSKRVAPIIAFGTLASKQAVRDVGRTMNIDLGIIDYICKQLDARSTLKDNINKNRTLYNYIHMDEELEKLYEISMKFEGIKRHTTIHAAGVVMSNIDIDEVIPLDKGHAEFYTTGYSMDYLEELGLLKMDFLALKNLTIIHNIIRDIDSDITFDNIKENDALALKVFENVDVLGIFQFESGGMVNFLRKFRPNTFEDVFAAIALFRPGPMQNIDSYIARKKGTEKIDYIHESLISILKPTYGVIVYQEQIMQIANIMAGYSLGEADILRRAMSKKISHIMQDEKDKFISRSIKRGYTEEVSNKVYELILKFASYGFNRAHSVAYSFVSYKMAYLKAHYPAYFMKNLMNTFLESEYKICEYINECKQKNISILFPDINKSDSFYSIEDNSIRFPLMGIKGIGRMGINEILKEKENDDFSDIYDFFRRCYGRAINKKSIESLIYAGCFDSFKITRSTLINNIDELINYSEISGGFDDVFNLKPELKESTEFPQNILLQKEHEVFGFYLTKHPVSEYKDKSVVKLSDLNNYFDKIIKTIILVDRKKEVRTKKNETMLFITGSDEITTVDIVLFPKIYEQYKNIVEGQILEISARVEKRFDKYQLVTNSIKILN